VAEPWAWLAVLPQRDPSAGPAAAVTVAGRDAGWLCAWVVAEGSWRRPHRDALRCRPDLVAADGGDLEVSLTVPGRRERPLHDDPAVVTATRRAAAVAGRLAAVGALVADEVHWAGGLAAVPPEVADGWPGWTGLDPWRGLGPSRVLRVGPGVLRPVALPAAPGSQRRAGAPWPAGRWSPPAGR
jgi:hypothetical protein